jgi:hypothetical protein
MSEVQEQHAEEPLAQRTPDAPVPGVAPIRQTGTWQDRLLPLMVRMLVGLTLFFLLASLVQLFYLNAKMELTPAVPTTDLVRPLKCPVPFTPDACVAIERMNTAAILEANVVERRYHQAGVLLMGRVWYTYLGLVTGMILAFVGAAFILGQLRMPASEVAATSVQLQVSIRSASPGLTLCILGFALMIITFVTPQEVKVKDVSVYFGTPGSAPADTEKPEVPRLVPNDDQRGGGH